MEGTSHLIVLLEFRGRLDETLVRQGWPESSYLISEEVWGVPGGYQVSGPLLPSSKLCLALQGNGQRLCGVRRSLGSENREEARRRPAAVSSAVFVLSPKGSEHCP